ncbi:MAG: hypothetical protein AAFU65_04455 [Pseudomonadota bacterium]
MTANAHAPGVPGALQATLETLYDVRSPARVEEYLVDDPGTARALDPNGRENLEKLLIREAPDTVDLSLYLAPDTLDRLRHDNPFVALNESNLAAFCTVLEGVSHLTYAACNAAANKSITLLELELQAEVDKFAVASLLLRRQVRRPQHRALMYRFFGRARFSQALNRRELERYAHASDAAGRFCARVMRPGRSARHRLADLRRFYRMPKLDKLAAC